MLAAHVSLLCLRALGPSLYRRAMHDVIFAERSFKALPERALLWVERRALLVADLHLEKASWFARGGQHLPPFDSQATLTQLIALADRWEVREIWALGDSFHDDDGPQRLGPAALALTERLAKGRRIMWIAGNHDRSARLPGEACTEAEVDGIILRHEARADETGYEISGHFHPKLRVHTAARSVSRPCFAVTGRRVILPAFGALTGGLDIRDAALAGLLGPNGEAWVATARGTLRFPLQQPVALPEPQRRYRRSRAV